MNLPREISDAIKERERRRNALGRQQALVRELRAKANEYAAKGEVEQAAETQARLMALERVVLPEPEPLGPELVAALERAYAAAEMETRLRLEALLPRREELPERAFDGTMLRWAAEGKAAALVIEAERALARWRSWDIGYSYAVKPDPSRDPERYISTREAHLEEAQRVEAAIEEARKAIAEASNMPDMPPNCPLFAGRCRPAGNGTEYEVGGAWYPLGEYGLETTAKAMP
ncbi:hypothetical protein [Kyrpidia tusciae]|uniref:Uncharacterized protein n=1 Tax=Kyrpidia tusciae (strain DSM 2912 / NBRC 15312 / T2) TaxID=562970 RepID=D5WQN1_KYRT2|nr:hypothetical protein [Kyrpidia tusciae]ADG06640.1 hypothetical protein Btus_1945 [Kyrpidia tusciae DSM 2912]